MNRVRVRHHQFLERLKERGVSFHESRKCVLAEEGKNREWVIVDTDHPDYPKSGRPVPPKVTTDFTYSGSTSIRWFELDWRARQPPKPEDALWVRNLTADM